MPEFLRTTFGLDFFLATIRLSTPLIFAALGCIFAERSGVINVSAEGMMLCGAFAATAGAVTSGSLWVGVLVGILVGMLLGLLLGYLTVTMAADQIVVGITLNILAVGVTSFLVRLWFPLAPDGADPTRTPLFPSLYIPVLSDIPFIGRLLFRQGPLEYLALALVPISSFVLFRTRPGLILRSAGESARTVDAAGINVYLVRYIGTTISGALCGLAGSYLTLGWVHVFIDNIPMGRGFIALAAVIFGKWNPFGALAACLLFAAGDALSIRLQGAQLGIRFEWLLMLPYVLTLIALMGVIGRSIPPAEEGIAYIKE